MLHTVVGGLSAVANEADLGNFSPGHRRQLKMKLNDELTNLFG